MDVLSVAASVVAIIQLSNEIIKGSRKYYIVAKNASKDIKHLLDELESFRQALNGLNEIVTKAETSVSGGVNNGNVPSHEILLNIRRMLEPNAPLTACFVEMQHFRHRMKRYESAVTRNLRWPFQRKETLEMVGRLRNLKSLLDTAIASDSVDLQLRVLKGVNTVTQSLEARRLENLNARLLQWLDAPDSLDSYDAAYAKRQAGTGVWLLQKSVFRNWKTASNSVLWIHGKPGSGKTVLSSIVIGHLKDSVDKDFIIAYFYFDFQRPEQVRSEGFLRSLIRQVSVQGSGVAQYFMKFYEESGFGQNKPTIQNLMVILEKLLKISGPVTIVIIAADECSDREILFKMLEDIHHLKQDSIHTLVTRRPEMDIEDSLNRLFPAQISLGEGDVNCDIHNFVHEQVYSDRAKLSKWSEGVRKEISSTLMKGADGMFRWVVCQLDALQRCLTLGELRAALETLPKSLNETYTRILENIPEQYGEHVRRILQFLVCSCSSLKLKEAADLVAINLGPGPVIDEEKRLREPRDVITLCSSLVSLRRSSEEASSSTAELELAHHSVKEYLTSDRMSSSLGLAYSFTEKSAHEAMSALCVHYLLQFDHDFHGQGLSVSDVDLVEAAPFTPYAARNWHYHFKASSIDRSSPVYEACLTLIKSRRILRLILRLAEWFLGPHILSKESYLAAKEPFVNPLCYASLHNLTNLMLSLISSGETVDLASDRTPLAITCFMGHEKAARLLLQAGETLRLDAGNGAFDLGSANPPPSHNQSCLQTKMLQPLPACGLEFDTVSGDSSHTVYNQPSVSVYRFDDVGCVRLFICPGSDLGKKGDQLARFTPRHAQCSNNDAVIRFLIEYIKCSMRLESCTSLDHALSLAAVISNSYAIRYLWGRGGRIGLRDTLATHIFTETFFRYIEHRDRPNRMIAVCNLLNPKLYDSSQHFEWVRSSLLYGAASRDYEDVVTLLLRFGTDAIFHHSLERSVNTSSSPLIMNVASKIGNVHIIKCLLRNGSGMKTHTWELQSALRIAVRNGDDRIASLLLDAGVNANYRARKFGSALHTARCRLARVYELIVLFMSSGDRELEFLVAKEASYGAIIETLLNHGAQAIPPARLKEYRHHE